MLTLSVQDIVSQYPAQCEPQDGRFFTCIWMLSYSEHSGYYWLGLNTLRVLWPFKVQEWLDYYRTHHPGRAIVAQITKPALPF